MDAGFACKYLKIQCQCGASDLLFAISNFSSYFIHMMQLSQTFAAVM